MKLLKIIFIFLLAAAYAGAMGSGWFFIYTLGIREAILPICELPIIPVSSFIYIYILILYVRTLYKKNEVSYDITDPKPYGKLLSNMLNIYLYAGIIGLIYLIFS